MQSLPSRERGLKCTGGSVLSGETSLVAPFAGAWIEIKRLCAILESPTVAPFAGAWIEIVYLHDNTAIQFVAPFAGAWIEIQLAQRLVFHVPSLPSRERGLKSFLTDSVPPRI